MTVLHRDRLTFVALWNIFPNRFFTVKLFVNLCRESSQYLRQVILRRKERNVTSRRIKEETGSIARDAKHLALLAAPLRFVRGAV